MSARGDASKVTCNGDGLVMGIMGREIRSTIDARRAGPGNRGGSPTAKRQSAAHVFPYFSAPFMTFLLTDELNFSGIIN